MRCPSLSFPPAFAFAEAENAFEDQLSADIDEIRDANREKAWFSFVTAPCSGRFSALGIGSAQVQRAMAREAALRRRAAEAAKPPYASPNKPTMLQIDVGLPENPGDSLRLAWAWWAERIQKWISGHFCSSPNPA